MSTLRLRLGGCTSEPAVTSPQVDTTQHFHSPGREDRIPYGTKVLLVAIDDLHVIGIESELGKRSLGRLLL